MIKIHRARFHQRQQPKLHRGRIAARVRDEARRADFLAIDFAQPVHGLGDQLRRGVLDLVPALPFGDILQAKVGGDVDDAHARVDERARLAHGDAVGCGEKHDVAFLQLRLVRMGEGERHVAAQAREQGAHRRARFLARSNRRELDLRVLCQQPQQFDARIARSADNSSLDHGVHLSKTKKPPCGGFSILGNSVPTLNVWSTACAAAPCASRPFFAPLRAHRASRGEPR